MNKKAFARIPILCSFLGLLLFISAGTLSFWQAWVFLSVFAVSLFGITLFLVTKAPKLLERRLNAGPSDEKQGIQKIIHFLLSKSLILAVIVPALDYRYGWSKVPVYGIAIGNLLVALGFVIVTRVFKENAFAFTTIEVVSEQKVILTGPYAYVRHPMYVGLIITFLGIPLALGSWWGLLTLIPILMILVRRVVEEELFLVKNLPGYSGYMEKVRYRLAPLLW
jgi:protein-S-isoprenylcysteine O-methyltransferase Ste14